MVFYLLNPCRKLVSAALDTYFFRHVPLKELFLSFAQNYQKFQLIQLQRQEAGPITMICRAEDGITTSQHDASQFPVTTAIIKVSNPG